MPPDTMRVLALIAAALLAGAGLWCLALGRRDESSAPALALPGVGVVSQITWLVSGLACLGVAYHLVAYTLNTLVQLRAPWWLALTVAAGAVLASLGVDHMENKKGS